MKTTLKGLTYKAPDCCGKLTVPNGTQDRGPSISQFAARSLASHRRFVWGPTTTESTFTVRN
jgi:hypothetical protein